MGDLVIVPATGAELVSPDDPDGSELSSADIAERLAESLRGVEVSTQGGKHEYQGFVVGVNVKVEGLTNVPLLLRWSLSGFDVPSPWDAADKIAYRLNAEESVSTGHLKVWVPDLKMRSAYNVVIEVERESDGVALTSTVTPLPGE